MRKKILSLVLAVMFITQLGVFAFADNDNKTVTSNPVNGEITVTSSKLVIKPDGDQYSYNIDTSAQNSVVTKDTDGTVNINASVNAGGSNVVAVNVSDENVNVNVNNGVIRASSENSKANGVQAYNNSEVNITRSDVSGKNSGIYADKKSTVNVDGSTVNVTGEKGIAVVSNNSAEVNLNNSVVAATGSKADAVTATNSSEATVNNSTITSAGDGISAFLGSNVSVNDSNVTSQGDAIRAGKDSLTSDNNDDLGNTGYIRKDITMSDDIQVVVRQLNAAAAAEGNNADEDDVRNIVNVNGSTIKADGTDSYAIVAGQDGTVIVKDSTVSGTNGICAVDKTSTVVVDGAVKCTGSGEDDTALLVLLDSVSDASEVKDKMPTVIVEKLEAVNGNLLKAEVRPDDIHITVTEGNQPVRRTLSEEEMTEAVAKEIYYIVNSIANASVTGYTVKTVNDGVSDITYQVANESDQLIVKVDNGYELVNGSRYATMVDNGDGTYTITVNRGGDLVFTAKVKPTNSVPYIETLASGTKDDGVSPVLTFNTSASSFKIKSILFDGVELSSDVYKASVDSSGNLTIKFTSDFINTVVAGSHTLTVVGTSSTITLHMDVSEDGTYTITY